jgi:recombination protein RecT
MSAIPQNQQLRPVDQFRKELTQMESQIKAVLPPTVPVERFSRVVLTAVQGKPELLGMDRAALFTACLECAKDGLIPDGKEAALVPFKGKPKYMPMVKGIIKAVHNSGEIADVALIIVCEKDDFKYWVDDRGEHVEHRPNIFADRGKMVGVYSFVKLRSGSVSIETMSKADVDKIREVSLAKNGPWGDWYEEMAKKSAFRRHSKRLPMSADAERVVQRDDDMFDLDGKVAALDKGKEITQAIRDSQKPPQAQIENKTEEEKSDSWEPPADMAGG